MLNTDTISITPEILGLIAEIDEFKGAWRALGTLAPQRLNALRHVATIESIGSSTRIEGSKLTDREVERLLANLEIKRFSSRDEQEVAGYGEVMETVFRAWTDIPFTENHIKQLHRDLLRYSEKDERHRGAIQDPSQRRGGVRRGRQHDRGRLRDGLTFRHAAPDAGACRLAEGCPRVGAASPPPDHRRLHRHLPRNPPLSGRQRKAQPGAHYAPVAAIRLFLCALQFAGERDRSQQGSLLPGAPADPGHDPHRRSRLAALADFLPPCPSEQKRRLAAKVEKEKLTIATLPELSANILERARETGRVTIGDMPSALTGASRNTLKEHFRRLIEHGHLVRHGNGKGAWYTIP